jgi:hypothetical protein
MNFKAILITVFLITGISFQSCSDDECPGTEYREFFDIQGIQVNHWGTDHKPIEEIEILFEEYGFVNLELIVDYIVHQQDRKFNFSLMNSAYACSPYPAGQGGSKEEAIESLQIISINDFDEDHKAGDPINNLLELSEIFEGTGPIPLEDYLNNLTGNVSSEYFRLRLLKELSLSNEFQVKVVINLSTGENYEATSDVIKFI